MRAVVPADGARSAVTLEGLDPDRVVAAVRDPDDDRIDCPTPDPVHEHVGYPAGDRRLERRAALAAVARSRGETAPQDDAVRAVREELSTLEVPDIDLAAARRRVVDAADERERLAERVARLQGRVRALRSVDEPTEEAVADLEAAARELAAVETDRTAAAEALARARDRAREARDARERRLALRDRLANRRRGARAHLASEVRPAVEKAVAAAGWTAVDRLEAAGDRTAALAMARVASLDAPVVTTQGVFDGAADAAGWLDAPVVHVYHR